MKESKGRLKWTMEKKGKVYERSSVGRQKKEQTCLGKK